MQKDISVALTIAGSDSGGGAGIQADLKTFCSQGVHGTSVITCVTAQNPGKVLQIEALRPGLIRSQLAAIFSELKPSAVKTGMLFSAETIRLVHDWFRNRRTWLVVDPVMVASSGARLLRKSALAELRRLISRASLVTPNLHEAQVLLGRRIQSPEELRQAARSMHEEFGCASLVKGGHLPGVRQAVDFFYDGKTELLLEAPMRAKLKTHGTGCTYSAAITGFLALGEPLPEAVRLGKDYVTQAIFRAGKVGRNVVLETRRAAWINTSRTDAIFC